MTKVLPLSQRPNQMPWILLYPQHQYQPIKIIIHQLIHNVIQKRIPTRPKQTTHRCTTRQFHPSISNNSSRRITEHDQPYTWWIMPMEHEGTSRMLLGLLHCTIHTRCNNNSNRVTRRFACRGMVHQILRHHHTVVQLALPIVHLLVSLLTGTRHHPLPQEYLYRYEITECYYRLFVLL